MLKLRSTALHANKSWAGLPLAFFKNIYMHKYLQKARFEAFYYGNVVKISIKIFFFWKLMSVEFKKIAHKYFKKKSSFTLENFLHQKRKKKICLNNIHNTRRKIF